MKHKICCQSGKKLEHKQNGTLSSETKFPYGALIVLVDGGSSDKKALDKTRRAKGGKRGCLASLARRCFHSPASAVERRCRLST